MQAASWGNLEKLTNICAMLEYGSFTEGKIDIVKKHEFVKVNDVGIPSITIWYVTMHYKHIL